MTKIIAQDGNLKISEDDWKLPLHKLLGFYKDENSNELLRHILFHIEMRLELIESTLKPTLKENSKILSQICER